MLGTQQQGEQTHTPSIGGLHAHIQADTVQLLEVLVVTCTGSIGKMVLPPARWLARCSYRFVM